MNEKTRFWILLALLLASVILLVILNTSYNHALFGS
jgi:hypothetical protein